MSNDKVKIEVHLKSRKMTVFAVDAKTKVSRILRAISHLKGGGIHMVHGKPKNFPTPTGTFGVTRMDKHHVSSEFHAPMPNAVFFSGGSAFHTGNVDQASHGCIHLAPADSEWLFNLMQTDKDNTEIQVSDD